MKRSSTRSPRAFFIIILCLATAFATALLVPRQLTPISAPERAVNRMMGSLQRGWLHRAEARTVDGLGLTAANRRTKKLYKAMFSTMRHTITGTVISEDKCGADVTVSITVVDMEALLSTTSQQLLEKSLDGKLVSERRYYNLLRKRIREGDPATRTSEVTLSLTRQDRRWKIAVGDNEDFLDAVTGGLGPL